MPKVSIVIPTYNVEQYLKECLDSVVNQTLKDIEIICVDDGATDNSGKILDEYAAKDSRIKVIHKENGGYGKAMNVGIDNATGEYIGIVEPDDYILPEMYETLYNKAKELNLDFIKSDFCRFTGDGENRKFVYNRLDKSNSYYDRVVNIQEDFKPFWFIMNTWSGIYNLEYLRRNNIRHNETPGASFQDNGFWLQTFMYSTRAYFLDKPVYMNRRDNPNSSVANKAKVYIMCDEYDWIRKIIDSNPNFKKFIPIYQHKRFCNYMFTLNRIDISFKKEFIKRFHKDFKLAMQNNEIDKDLFTELEYYRLQLVIKNPDKFYRKYLNRMSLAEKLFSVKNRGIHKVIRLFGIKFKFKNKKLIERAEKQRSQEQINNLNRKLDSIIKTQKINSGKFAELQSSLCTINDNVNEVQDSLREISGIEQKFNLSFENFRESLKQNAATLQKNLDTISDCQNNQINTLNNKVNLNSTMLDELQYSVVLNQSWIDSEWVKNKSFSLRLGSSNYSFIYSLFKILDEIAPSRILEFGLGQTTKLTSQYVNNKNTNAALDIVEHDNDWINEFSGQITLTNNIKIYHKNLIKFEINGVETDKYDDLSDIVTDKKYDLIIIDGPFGFDRIYPRTNILDLIPNNLAENFVIILDDAERKGEQNTANLIFNKLDACNIQYEKSYKKGLKTQLIISSTNHKYIHWI